MANPSTLKHRIVLVLFPFDDLSGTKVRPALCLTDPIGSFNHIVIAFISSQFPASPFPTDLVLDPVHPSFPSTGLRVKSFLRPLHRLTTVTTSLIRRDIGMLDQPLIVQVKQRLRRLLEL